MVHLFADDNHECHGLIVLYCEQNHYYYFDAITRIECLELLENSKAGKLENEIFIHYA